MITPFKVLSIHISSLIVPQITTIDRNGYFKNPNMGVLRYNVVHIHC